MVHLTWCSIWAVGEALFLTACHATPIAEPAPRASLGADPVQAVRALRVLATGGGSADYVDEAFSRRMPSAGELDAALAPGPEGCDIQLSRHGGYQAIAIPPPMIDDAAERVIEIDAIVAVLRRAVEVHGQCTMVSEPEIDEDGEIPGEPYQLAVFAVALRQDEQTGWRVLGWRRFLDE